MNYKNLPRTGSGDIDTGKVAWPVEIDLLRPVETGGERLERVTLREPEAIDIETAWNRSPSEATRMVHLVALLAGLKPAAVRKLKAADFMRASRLVGAFL